MTSQKQVAFVPHGVSAGANAMCIGSAGCSLFYSLHLGGEDSEANDNHVCYCMIGVLCLSLWLRRTGHPFSYSGNKSPDAPATTDWLQTDEPIVVEGRR